MYFKKGQTVYSIAWGEGVVRVVENGNYTYPVGVQFQDNYITYTLEGREQKDENITLFQNPITVIPNKKLVPFTQGDWIVITKSKTNWNSAMNSMVNRVVKIEHVLSILGMTKVLFKGSGINSYIFEDGHFRMAKKEEIPV